MIGLYIPQSFYEAGCERRGGLESLYDASTSAMRVEPQIEGPDEGVGQLFYVAHLASTKRAIVSYVPQEQIWRPASQHGDRVFGRYWIGFWKEDRPLPEELQRDRISDGFPVALGDGREWVIPIAEFLPKRLTFDTVTGREKEVVADCYREFTEKANQIFESFVSNDLVQIVEGEHTVRIPEGLQFAADALQINYRVNRDLVDSLGLISNYEAIAVAEVATGMKLIADAQKKTLLSAIFDKSPPKCLAEA